MIKILSGGFEATLNGHVWSCDDKDIEEILNWQTQYRPARHEWNPQRAIVDHIIKVFPNIEIEILEDTGRDETLDAKKCGVMHDLDWLDY
jgi:hypothetical protein